MSRERRLQLWEAKRVLDSATNHATGEVVHPLARMCAFIPSSVPITLGMLTMTGPAATVGLQWLNQSYNALFNYSHRSKADTTKDEILKAYGVATLTSCGLALGLSRFSNRIKPAFIIPTIAVMTAGCANVAFTRANEFRQGINVYNDSNEVVGVSKIAGKYAVGYTMLSRSIFLPIPIMVLPGLLSEFIRKRVSKGGKVRDLGISLGCIILSQALALPFCIALFPMTIKIKTADLEPELTKSYRGEYVYINKGI
jgi:sideroflexin-5